MLSTNFQKMPKTFKNCLTLSVKCLIFLLNTFAPPIFNRELDLIEFIFIHCLINLWFFHMRPLRRNIQINGFEIFAMCDQKSRAYHSIRKVRSHKDNEFTHNTCIAAQYPCIVWNRNTNWSKWILTVHFMQCWLLLYCVREKERSKLEIKSLFWWSPFDELISILAWCNFNYNDRFQNFGAHD